MGGDPGDPADRLRFPPPDLPDQPGREDVLLQEGQAAVQEPRFLPRVRRGRPAVPTHAPGPACSSPTPSPAPGSQAGTSPLPLAPASFLAAPGWAPEEAGPASEPLLAGWLLLCPPSWPRNPGKGMPRGSAAPEPLSVGAGVRGGCLAAAGLLPCLDEAHLPWHQGRDAPSASLSGRGPAPSPCRALPPPSPLRAQRVGLEKTTSSPPACHDPTAHCLADRGGAFPWLRAGGALCLTSLRPAPRCSPGAGGGQHPLPSRAGVQGPVPASGSPQGSETASYQRACAAAVPAL